MIRIWVGVILTLSFPVQLSAEQPAHTPGQETGLVAEAPQTYVPAKAIERIPPKYPRKSLNRGHEAWIDLACCVDESGVPQNVSVLDATGDASFQQQAVEMMKDWRFEPALVDGKPAWQSRNRLLVFFAMENRPKGAHGWFIVRFRKIGRLIDAGKLDQADELFRELLDRDQLNLYELGKLWAQHARLELKRGNPWMIDLALRRATISDGDWIDEESYLKLMASRVRNSLKLGRYGAAFYAYEKLIEKAGNDAPLVQELRPLMDRLQEKVDSDSVLEAPGEIREHDECFGCDRSYWFTPVRKHFAFANIDGTLSSIEMRCDHKRLNVEISELVEWQIPDEWGACDVFVYGEPGTKFTLQIFPEA